LAARILVVEDDAEARALFVRVLSGHGYEVRSAANGAEAFEEMERSGRPDVILLDLMMPVMSGWEFCAHCDADPSFASVPLVLMSAQHNLERAQSCRAARLLAKPFPVAALYDTVRDAVQDAVLAKTMPAGTVH
jgi:two-component system chemotaxis response regulator CheY